MQTTRPFLLFYGENEYLRTTRIQALQAELEGYGTESFPASEPLSGLLDRAQEVPLFDAGRLLRQQDPEWLGEGASAEELERYLADPNPQTRIVVEVTGKIDGRRKVCQFLRKQGLLVSCDPPKPWELDRFLQEECQRRQMQAGPEARQAILALAGNNQSILVQEIEKLSLCLGGPGEVTVALVESLCSRSAEAGIFDFLDAFSRQDGARAMETLQDLLRMREPEVRIVHMLARQLRVMLWGRLLREQGCTDAEIVRRTGINPYAWKKTAPAAEAMETGVLKAWLYRTARLDRDIKSGKGEPARLLEAYVIGFCLQDPAGPGGADPPAQ